MLYYPEDVIEKLEKLEKQPTDPAQYERFARKLLGIDPDDGVARLLLAASAEEAGDLAEDENLKKKPDPPEIEQRILPYRLLNDLQKQAEEDVRSATVKEIIKEGERCGPLFYYSLRQLARDEEDLTQPFPLLLIAMLGEISGPEM